MTADIERMIKERDSLGLFKGKEKKALETKIGDTKAKRDALCAAIAAEAAELDKKLAPLNNRLKEIDLQLAEGR